MTISLIFGAMCVCALILSVTGVALVERADASRAGYRWGSWADQARAQEIFSQLESGAVAPDRMAPLRARLARIPAPRAPQAHVPSPPVRAARLSWDGAIECLVQRRTLLVVPSTRPEIRPCTI
jgi:hypothetical protein